MKCFIKICTLLLMVTTPSILANDTFLGSIGGNVFPSRSNTIQMVRENIYIQCLMDRCLVNCKFWFHNSDSKEWVRVGFPNYHVGHESDSIPLKNFTAKIDNRDVRIRNAKQITVIGDEEPVEKHWFVWENEFPGYATTLIENTYSGSYGGSFYSIWFSYQIGTGRTWNGPIKEGKIVFDHSAFASDLFVFRRPPRSDQIRMMQYPDSLVYTFDNYTPQPDETLDIEILVYKKGSGYDMFKDYLTSSSRNRSQLRLMRNEIFARKGYIFKDPDLTAYFNKRKWYHPNPDFSLDLMDETELEAVQIFKEVEDQRSR